MDGNMLRSVATSVAVLLCLRAGDAQWQAPGYVDDSGGWGQNPYPPPPHPMLPPPPTYMGGHERQAYPPPPPYGAPSYQYPPAVGQFQGPERAMPQYQSPSPYQFQQGPDRDAYGPPPAPASMQRDPDLKVLAKECLSRDLTNGPVNFQLPGVCQQFTCINQMSGNVKKARVISQQCELKFVSPPCYTSEVDSSVMYPDCCPQVMCPSK